jgi:HEPN domain-containing protein
MTRSNGITTSLSIFCKRESCFLIPESSSYLSRKISIRHNGWKNRLRNSSIGLRVPRIFFSVYQDTFNRANYKEAAFLLHQTTERFYSAILLVFTDYKPRIHDIEILGNQVIKLHAEFAIIFPRSTEEEKRLFVLLKKAYIDARYNRNYKIEKAELEYLGSRVALLRDLTERVCRERIGQFIEGAS